MKIYIIQTFDPAEKEYYIEVISEPVYRRWIAFMKRKGLDGFVEIIKTVDLTEEEAATIKAEI